MALFDRIRRQGAPKTPQEADALALRQLQRRGADLSKQRHIIHFLYFPLESDAHAAVRTIGEAWRAKVEPPGESVAEWCVRADGERIVSSDTVGAFRAWFEAVAASHNGEYDGWEAAAKP